jgi:hypothetical protein
MPQYRPRPANPDEIGNFIDEVSKQKLKAMAQHVCELSSRKEERMSTNKKESLPSLLFAVCSACPIPKFCFVCRICISGITALGIGLSEFARSV